MSEVVLEQGFWAHLPKIFKKPEMRLDFCWTLGTGFFDEPKALLSLPLGVFGVVPTPGHRCPQAGTSGHR